MRIVYLLFSLLFLALQVSPGKMKEELKGGSATMGMLIPLDMWGEDNNWLMGKGFLRELTFQHGQTCTAVLEAVVWVGLHLPCHAESEGRNFVAVVSGLSSPKRDMLFCKRGTCHFGRCPSHLIKVGRCFGFRSCCKWWVWHSLMFIHHMSRQIHFARDAAECCLDLWKKQYIMRAAWCKLLAELYSCLSAEMCTTMCPHTKGKVWP